MSVCCLFFLLVLAGIGAALFFLFPRMPTLKISDPYFPDTAKGFKIPKTGAGSAWKPGFNTEGSILTTSSDPFKMQIGLGVNISVFSPNYVAFTVKRLTISVSCAISVLSNVS